MQVPDFTVEVRDLPAGENRRLEVVVNDNQVYWVEGPKDGTDRVKELVQRLCRALGMPKEDIRIEPFKSMPH